MEAMTGRDSYEELVAIHNALVDRYNKRHWKWHRQLVEVMLFLAGAVLSLPLLFIPRFSASVLMWISDRRHLVETMERQDDRLSSEIDRIARRLDEIEQKSEQQ